MAGYIGTQPVPQATQTRDVFTATAGQTVFNTSGYTPGYLDVYLNGVHLTPVTDYNSSNGTSITLTAGANLDDVLEVIAYTAFEIANVSGGATGGGSDQVFIENDKQVTADYTIPATKNAMSTGILTITDGVTVTVSSGSRWVII